MNWEAFGNFEDILYHKGDGVAKVTINRPHKRNAFRPKTVSEMYEAFLDAREDPKVGVVLLTGAGPHTDGKYAFCSGGDQSVRGEAGYVDDGAVGRIHRFLGFVLITDHIQQIGWHIPTTQQRFTNLGIGMVQNISLNYPWRLFGTQIVFHLQEHIGHLLQYNQFTQIMKQTCEEKAFRMSKTKLVREYTAGDTSIN